MNQTGDRWLFLPDTADWLNEPENVNFLTVQCILSNLVILAMCLRNLQHSNNVFYLQTVLTVLASFIINCYHLLPIDYFDRVDAVNIFWAILFLNFFIEILSYVARSNNLNIKNKYSFQKPKEKSELFYDPQENVWNIDEVKLKFVRSTSFLMLNSLMLTISLLMRPHNIIMVPSIYFTCSVVSKCLGHKVVEFRWNKNTAAVDVLSCTLVHLWIGQVFFFYQGNSNSLASVDLGAGYVGLREYSAERVAARMGLHTYAGPALAGAALYCRLAAHATNYPQYLLNVWRAVNIYAFQRVYAICVYSIIAMLFRDHLFVWSVFSPKLLYDFVATVFTVQALLTVAVIIKLSHTVCSVARWVAKKY